MLYDNQLDVKAIPASKLRGLLGLIHHDILIATNGAGNLAMFYEDKFAGWIDMLDESICWVKRAIPPEPTTNTTSDAIKYGKQLAETLSGIHLGDWKSNLDTLAAVHFFEQFKETTQ